MTDQLLPDVSELELLGDSFCLDFANTIDRDRNGLHRHECLTDPRSLIDWAQHAGVINPATARLLHKKIEDSPVHAGEVFRQALDLREAIQQTFTAVADGREPDRQDLDCIHQHYREAVSEARLEADRTGVDWTFPPDPTSLRQVLDPIAVAAVDLLRTGPLSRLKRCPGDNDQCGWLFIDTSKNGSRKWCSMQTCGTRDKMRRYYRRKRESSVS